MRLCVGLFSLLIIFLIWRFYEHKNKEKNENQNENDDNKGFGSGWLY